MRADFNKGKIEKLWPFLVELHRENPHAFEVNGDFLKREVAKRWKQLDQKEQCPNCLASMQEYVHKADYYNARLMIEMANVVKRKQAEGKSFTEANRVHIQTDISKNYATQSRTTQASKLGLVTKIMTDEGTHDQKEGWLITARGWAFLRGEPVPRAVKVFRNEIIERSEETITILQALADRVDGYDPKAWIGYGGIAEGSLL